MPHIPAPLLALGKVCGDACDVSVATREKMQVPPHVHPTTNYVTVTEGRLHVTVDGIERAFGPGEWCCIPANTEHSERYEEKTSVVVFWVKAA